jgi:hypothetical protein
MLLVAYLLAQAAAEPLPSQPTPRASPDDIVVTARPDEHPARLGPVLPDNPEPLLPRARFGLPGGASVQLDGGTNAREGVAEGHVKLTIPF